MKKICTLFFSLFLLLSVAVNAQELNVKLTVSAPRLQTTDPKVFEALQQSLKDFMNNQKWTDDVFENQERIKVQIQLTIKEELSANSYKAQLNIQVVRPVFGSNYETPIFNYSDDNVSFTYEQFQPIQYTKEVYNDNLTAVLAFYAYYALGLDYDTFSPQGGEPYFQQAMNIWNLVPANLRQGDGGWQQKVGIINRYWLIENLTNPKAKTYRQAIYDYHRLGLDIMAQNVEGGKNKMLSALEAIETYQKANQTAALLQIFNRTKSPEIINIFKVATPVQKSKVYNIMSRLDPAGASKYNELGL